jgi:hypothetical protein
MTTDELNEIIKFLTEECARKILDLGDVFIPYNIYPDDITEEEYMEEVNPTSLEIFNYYSTIRGYFINQLLALENKELTEEEYDEEYEKQIWHWDGYLKDMQQVFQEEEFYEDDDSEDSEEEFFDDDFEELDYDEKIAELYKRIDLLDKEYIKKIVDEIGCCSYNIMEPDRWLEEYDEEGERFTPQFKQARELLVEYFDRRWILIDKLEEVDGGDPNNYYLDLNHAFAQKYIEYWSSKE